MEQPFLVTDLYPRVKDVTLDCKTVVRQHDTLRHLGEVMRKSDLKSVPVTDSNGELVGIVTVSDLAKRYFLELGLQSLVDMRVRYRDIIQATDSKVLVAGDEKNCGGQCRNYTFKPSAKRYCVGRRQKRYHFEKNFELRYFVYDCYGRLQSCGGGVG